MAIVDAMLFIISRAGRHIRIDADDRFDSFTFALFEKFDCAVEVPTIGHSERCLPVSFCRTYNCRDFWQGIKEGIMGMGVEMDEFWSVRHAQNISRNA